MSATTQDHEYELAAADSAAAVLEHYDPAQDSWAFDRSTPLWSAVDDAHRRGYRGRGKRVAIIDGGFDRAFPALRRSADVIEQPAGSRRKSRAHGSAVALLAHAVAPDARLLLYGVDDGERLSQKRMLAAIDAAVAAGADAINLSLGHRKKQKDHRCALYDALSRVAENTAITVTVSVGNNQEAIYCPGHHTTLFSAGFRDEERHLTEDLQETAVHTEPEGYTQTIGPRITFQQPGGVLGSSFAAPLLCGYSALSEGRDVLAALTTAAQLEGAATYMLAMNDTADEAGRAQPYGADTIAALYNDACAEWPHWHDMDESWCAYCGLFAHNVLGNAGLFTLRMHQLDTSERLLRLTYALSPWSEQAAANLGRLLFLRVEMARANAEPIDPANARAVLLSALKLYRKANARRPGFTGYDEVMGQITAVLADYPG